jgi:hypothetical protein
LQRLEFLTGLILSEWDKNTTRIFGIKGAPRAKAKKAGMVSEEDETPHDVRKSEK